MAYNSYHRRGSRSVVQAAFGYSKQSNSSGDIDELQLASVNASDVRILNAPTARGTETISEDSRIFTNEVKSEEFALLSTSSDTGTCSLETYSTEEHDNQQPVQMHDAALMSKSDIIDAWCVQSNQNRTLPARRTSRKSRDIIKAWGVDEDLPLVAYRSPSLNERPPKLGQRLDNYTAHLLDRLNRREKQYVREFTQAMLPLLKRRNQSVEIPSQFQTIPSIFPDRELLWRLALHGEDAASLSALQKLLKEVPANGSSANSEDYEQQRSRSASLLDSWHSWNLVPHIRADS
ncbi:LAMI_0G07954g1_1 [Lachancea mirantina]|uniref:LAMI_0G07954g1_1 n=1 Tax=Lachancea mirantina TaxID=1230905 RepID=A0A1G4K9U7_9SACH|nr:LAMI_0G07954g1_1 [Lachancea mirantina]